MEDKITVDQEVCDFIKAQCYNKMIQWRELVDKYGTDFLREKIEENIQAIYVLPKDKITVADAFARMENQHEIYIYRHTEEPLTVDTFQNNSHLLEIMIHEAEHLVWEQEGKTGCFRFQGDGEALNEGLTEWGKAKMQNKIVQKSPYLHYTVLCEILERHLGKDAVLSLFQDDRTALEKALGKENTQLFLGGLDTHLQLTRASIPKAQLSELLTQLIACMETGMDVKGELANFYTLQKKAMQLKDFQRREWYMLENFEEGTIDYYRHLNDMLVKISTEGMVEAKHIYCISADILAENLLLPRIQALQKNKKKDMQTFQELSQSVAELLHSCQFDRWDRISPERTMYDVPEVAYSETPHLEEMRKEMLQMKENWKQEILAQMRKNAHKPKKWQSSLAEMSTLFQTIRWEKQDEDWYKDMAEAMGIGIEKVGDMADLIVVAEQLGDIQNFGQYSMEFLQQGNRVIKRQGKPVAFWNTEECFQKEILQTVEEYLKTLPDSTVDKQNLANFYDWTKSKEPEAQICIMGNKIMVTHEHQQHSYYQLDENAQMQPLYPIGEKQELQANGKEKKPSLRTQLQQWVKRKFTSHTPLKQLTEGNPTVQVEPIRTFSTFQEQRRAFLDTMQPEEKIHKKQTKEEKQAQKRIERAERKWMER